jgi:hypothetical protein
MDISDILGGVAEEHGILSSQCARVQAAASKLKGQTKANTRALVSEPNFTTSAVT